MTICIYCIALALSLLSLPTLICSINSKSKNICTGIIIVCVAYIIYMFSDLYALPSALEIEVGLEILIFYMTAFIAGILYITSAVIAFVKIRRNTDEQTMPNKIPIAVTALLTIPILIFSAMLFRELYLIRNSDLILVYYSEGNGGFGDGRTFAYAVSDRYCEQFDTGISFRGYDIEKILPESITDIDDTDDIIGYEIDLNDDGILVYKDGELIHQKQHKSDYFNINFEKAFYINHK